MVSDMNYVEELRDRLYKEIKVNNNLLNLYCLLILIKGENVTLEDIHDAWSLDKNRTFPEHWSIVPFRELNHDVQIKDMKYLMAIKKVAREYER